MIDWLLDRPGFVGGAMLLAGLVIALIVAAMSLPDPEPKAPTPTTTTSLAPFCDEAGARIYPGTGIVESHDACPQPELQHAPAGTGPNTGPRGEAAAQEGEGA